MLLLVAAFASGLHRHVSLETLRENYDAWREWAGAHPALAGLGFVALYAGAVTISLPGALWLTMAAGVLFGWAFGGFYAWLGATTGAVLIFIAARTAFQDAIRARMGGKLEKFRAGFERDSFFYIVMLRLIPLPFFLVNVAPALFRVRIATFAGATALGIIPGTLAYAAIGAGVGEALAEGARVDLSLLSDPRLVLGFLGLAVLAVMPVILRRAGLLGGAGRS